MRIGQRLRSIEALQAALTEPPPVPPPRPPHPAPLPQGICRGTSGRYHCRLFSIPTESGGQFRVRGYIAPGQPMIIYGYRTFPIQSADGTLLGEQTFLEVEYAGLRGLVRPDVVRRI